ncbi:MAG: hypothetical protein ACK5TN_11515 [Acidobacteriota bacterium]|jgi:hypothetical protein
MSMNYRISQNDYKEKTQLLFRTPFLSLCAFILFLYGCGDDSLPARPANVPPDAVFLLAGKGVVYWQHCKAGFAGDPPYCHIWNGAGSVLYQDEFLPYDEGAFPKAEELIIIDNNLRGPDHIILKNNRILLPKSRFEDMKEFFDWRFGKIDKLSHNKKNR